MTTKTVASAGNPAQRGATVAANKPPAGKSPRNVTRNLAVTATARHKFTRSTKGA